MSKWVADFTFTLSDVEELLESLEETNGSPELIDSLEQAIQAGRFYEALEDV